MIYFCGGVATRSLETRFLLELSPQDLEESEDELYSDEDELYSDEDESLDSLYSTSSSESSKASRRLFTAGFVALAFFKTQASITKFSIPLISFDFLNVASETSVACTFSANISGFVNSDFVTRYCVDKVIRFQAVT